MKISKIDNVLLHNKYFKNLSVADRLAIYDQALKEMPDVYYENQSAPIRKIATDYNGLLLSTIDNYDSILIDDLEDFTESERIVIYNIAVERIANLRNAQLSVHYLLSNTHTVKNLISNLNITISKSINMVLKWLQYSKFSVSVSRSIKEALDYLVEKPFAINVTRSITTLVIYSKNLQMVVGRSISSLAIAINTKNLALNVTRSITDLFILTQQKTMSISVGRTIIPITEYNQLELDDFRISTSRYIIGI